MLNTCSYPTCGLYRRDGNLYAHVLLTTRNASEDLCNRWYPSSEMHTLAHATHPDSGTDLLLATASPKFLLSGVKGDWVELQLSSPASPSWHSDTAVSPRCLSAATARRSPGHQHCWLPAAPREVWEGEERRSQQKRPLYLMSYTATIWKLARSETRLTAVTHRPLRPSRNKETSAEAVKQQTQRETKMMKEGHDKLELLNTICLPDFTHCTS